MNSELLQLASAAILSSGVGAGKVLQPRLWQVVPKKIRLPLLALALFTAGFVVDLARGSTPTDAASFAFSLIVIAPTAAGLREGLKRFQ